MSKSRRYTIPGTTSGSKYVFTFNDNGEIEGVKKQSQLGRPFLSVDPNSTEFQKVTSTSQALNAYNVNNHKGRKDNYETEIKIASNEQKDNKHDTEKKKEDNEEKNIDDTSDNTSGVVSANPTVKNNKKETLRYPYDIDLNQDHLKIVQYEYKRTEINSSKPTSSVVSDKNKPFGEYGGGVILPMPKVSDSNGAEWGKSDLNVFGIGALGIAGSLIKDFNEDKVVGANLFGEFGSRIGVGGKGQLDDEAAEGNRLRQIIAGKSSQIQQDIKNTSLAGLGIGAQQLSKLAGIDVSADEVLARTTGKILNPNAELLFQGPVLRDFGFKFLMIARSQKEGEEIRKIIRFFKAGGAPRYLGGPALLGTPNIFQLKYMRDKSTELETVNKFNEMALRTITVDYAPDGFWSAYQDSQPVAVVMSLQFSELRPLYSSDHEETSDSSVGY
tara:strand:- start:33 stop:1358 length:1326 start_codon:yes stop_codon:yes gene_type:complete